jgi:hypothetical protein
MTIREPIARELSRGGLAFPAWWRAVVFFVAVAAVAASAALHGASAWPSTGSPDALVPTRPVVDAAVKKAELTVPPPTGAVVAVPRRLARSEAFLGVHFDFHAGPDGTEIGRRTTPEAVAAVLDLVRPDFVQVDGKGHAGYASWPTRFGTAAPGFVRDALKIWREVTAARGVSLYVHYSGVWDSMAVKRPGWAVQRADGTPDERATSFWGPYLQQQMLPQLRELAGDYGVDGVWVDGDCWSVEADYRPEAVAEFLRVTGGRYAQVPRGVAEPGWDDWMNLHREAYRRFLGRYVAEMASSHPRFEVCSNWAFSDHMPEPVTVPVALLSGDLSWKDSVNAARLGARYLAWQGRPWDLMAWSFVLDGDRRRAKGARQIERELALVMAQGGSVQVYFGQERDASVDMEKLAVMGEVAAFCRARQPWVHGGVPMSDVAVILSTEATYRGNPTPFGRRQADVRHALRALVERGWTVDVVGEHALRTDPLRHRVVVVPDRAGPGPELAAVLADRVARGGDVVLAGSSVAFQTAQAAALPLAGAVGTVVVLAPSGDDTRAGSALADSLVRAVEQRVPVPTVRISGVPVGTVEVVTTRKDDAAVLHVINTSGPHATELVVDRIDPTGPVTVDWRRPAAPREVMLQPGSRPVDWAYSNGVLRVTVPRIDVHEIIVVRDERSGAVASGSD